MKRNDSKTAAKAKANPHKPKRDFKAYLKFLMIALVIVFLVDHFVFKGERPYITKMKADYYAEEAERERRTDEAIKSALPPKVVYPSEGEYFEAPAELENQVTPPQVAPPSADELQQNQSMLPEKALNLANVLAGIDIPEPVQEKSKEVVKVEEPAEKKPAEKPAEKLAPLPKKTFKGGKPKIAIVIDDVGMNVKQSRVAIELDPDVTIAFLPYAQSVKKLAAKAKANGNEMIIHAPMEAMSADVPLGSMALMSDMPRAAFTAEFDKMSNSFDGYVGINNHMGSKLTQNPRAMTQLMRELKSRNLFFLDSKTIHTSVAAHKAVEQDVPYAVRDVFLDHEETPEFTAKALAKLERVARAHGQAIAIGHPKEITMSALKAWIPTLEQKGFELVPVSALLNKPKVPAVKQAKVATKSAPKVTTKAVTKVKTVQPKIKIVKQKSVAKKPIKSSNNLKVRQPQKSTQKRIEEQSQKQPEKLVFDDVKTEEVVVSKTFTDDDVTPQTLEPQHIEPAAGFSSYDDAQLGQNLLLLE